MVKHGMLLMKQTMTNLLKILFVPLMLKYHLLNHHLDMKFNYFQKMVKNKFHLIMDGDLIHLMEYFILVQILNQEQLNGFKQDLEDGQH